MNELTQKQVDAIGREYLDLKAAKVAAEARMKELEEQLREHFEYGNYGAGPAKISVQRNVSRNNEAFMQAYPFEKYPDFYKPAIDTDEIKNALAPRELEKFQVVGAPKVIVTPIPGA